MIYFNNFSNIIFDFYSHKIFYFDPCWHTIFCLRMLAVVCTLILGWKTMIEVSKTSLTLRMTSFIRSISWRLRSIMGFVTSLEGQRRKYLLGKKYSIIEEKSRLLWFIRLKTPRCFTSKKHGGKLFLSHDQLNLSKESIKTFMFSLQFLNGLNHRNQIALILIEKEKGNLQNQFNRKKFELFFHIFYRVID